MYEMKRGMRNELFFNFFSTNLQYTVIGPLGPPLKYATVREYETTSRVRHYGCTD
jgi:hypothetical protein